LHNNPTSLLKIQHNNIRLEIYLDKYNQAKGYIYMDDGLTFNYTINDLNIFNTSNNQ